MQEIPAFSLELLVTLCQFLPLFDPSSFRESFRCSRWSRLRSSSKSSESMALPSVSWMCFRIPTSMPTHRCGFSGIPSVSLPSTVTQANHSPVGFLFSIISLIVSVSGMSRCFTIGISASLNRDSTSDRCYYRAWSRIGHRFRLRNSYGDF